MSSFFLEMDEMFDQISTLLKSCHPNFEIVNNALQHVLVNPVFQVTSEVV